VLFVNGHVEKVTRACWTPTFYWWDDTNSNLWWNLWK